MTINIDNKAYNKITILRALLRLREWSNTECGERIITNTLAAVAAIGLTDAVLLFVGWMVY